ncbi:ABC transporter permease [Pseudobacteriovorax antillogorgiicola]|uniref:ABC-2 type transport system permease protein n=1 Tax=Pseudobacteriovorax antillogorgiicola TaxID=1513793 RepID=A0A1Y6B7G2_9BACT|nr:ABC-2 transporter permease [Pseudobacteriovorax antillogorgiicola]TCS59347.1 ABC-2 type transport system permease protein [Pseudobacteriovorax antillogorgiicola]SME89101.1 ABC-2 type transport system permease protein [Pseudobacteriovorax antillogorgiicola]
MSSVFLIAKRDLVSYFHSLKGSIIFWFFLIFMGFFFHSFVFTFVEYQAQSAGYGGGGPTLSQLLTAIFHNLHFILLLIVPAVTMASFAEEKRTQVDRLLRTSPVTMLQIVLGKFFASIGVLTLVLIASMVFPAYTMIYGNADIGAIASSYLGVFLLMSSQVALGIWISSMTSNQFIAFVFTMFGLFLLLILNWIAPNITSSGGAEEFVKYLASTTHLDNFFKGLITVADLVYFALFTATFLLFAHVSLDSQRWR